MTLSHSFCSFIIPSFLTGFTSLTLLFFALTQDDVARIVAEQITLAFQALKAGDSQTPLILGDYGRTGQVSDR